MDNYTARIRLKSKTT